MTTPAADHLRHLLASRTEPLLAVSWPAGYPNRRRAVSHLTRIASAGAAILEVGFPCEGEHHDGAGPQDAYAQALNTGCGTDDVLDTVWQLAAIPGVAVAVRVHEQSLLDHGAAQLAFDLAQSGAAAVVVPDLPAELRSAWEQTVRDAGLLGALRAPSAGTEHAVDAAQHVSGWLEIPSVPLTAIQGQAGALRGRVPGLIVAAGPMASTREALSIAPAVDIIRVTAQRQPGAVSSMDYADAAADHVRDIRAALDRHGVSDRVAARA